MLGLLTQRSYVNPARMAWSSGVPLPDICSLPMARGVRIVAAILLVSDVPALACEHHSDTVVTRLEHALTTGPYRFVRPSFLRRGALATTAHSLVSGELVSRATCVRRSLLVANSVGG